MTRKVTGLLPQISFGILLALSLKPRHGYGLMQQLEQDSFGRLKLGPGSLYAAIKQLCESGLIEEMPFEDEKGRRRYYRLTKQGWDRLGQELEYFRTTVQLAQERYI